MTFIITKTLEEHILEAMEQVNKLAGDKILEKYPLYKQLNLSQDQNSEECKQMYLWINYIRAFASTAKDKVKISVSVVELRELEQNYRDNLNKT